MVEEKPRIQKVLLHLYDAEGTVRPKEIADTISESSLNVGKDLHNLKERGLAESEGEGQWKITDKGREWLEGGGKDGKGLKDERSEAVSETVPSQADLFKAEGQRIGFGSRKGDIKLEAVVNYVERIADLDDLTSVWNALTEMGVATDVKKRWIKLYAQNLPGKEISEELKEKLEIGLETEKVKSEGTEVSPKPKRFSIVNGQLIGDPEGDYNFKEALQVVAQERGASPEEAKSFALEMAKQGPEMLAQLMPLITKEPPQQDNTMITLLQQRIEQLADDKHKAEMESLRAEIRTGQRSPEEDEKIQALSQQVGDLREEIRQKELQDIREQNAANIAQLVTEINKLKQEVRAGAQGKQVESKIGLLDKALEKGTDQLSGLRADAKSFVQTIMEGRGIEIRERTSKEKATFSEGLDKGIERARAARTLEDDLFFGGEEKG